MSNSNPLLAFGYEKMGYAMLYLPAQQALEKLHRIALNGEPVSFSDIWPNDSASDEPYGIGHRIIFWAIVTLPSGIVVRRRIELYIVRITTGELVIQVRLSWQSSAGRHMSLAYYVWPLGLKCEAFWEQTLPGHKPIRDLPSLAHTPTDSPPGTEEIRAYHTEVIRRLWAHESLRDLLYTFFPEERHAVDVNNVPGRILAWLTAHPEAIQEITA
jgi:hypothetical protein